MFALYDKTNGCFSSRRLCKLSRWTKAWTKFLETRLLLYETATMLNFSASQCYWNFQIYIFAEQVYFYKQQSGPDPTNVRISFRDFSPLSFESRAGFRDKAGRSLLGWRLLERDERFTDKVSIAGTDTGATVNSLWFLPSCTRLTLVFSTPLRPFAQPVP